MSIPPYTSYSLLAQLRFHGPLLWQLPRYILRAFAPLSLNCTLCVKPLFLLYPTLLTMCPYLTSWIWSGEDYLMMLLVLGRLSYLKVFITNISEFSVLSRNASNLPAQLTHLLFQMSIPHLFLPPYAFNSPSIIFTLSWGPYFFALKNRSN